VISNQYSVVSGELGEGGGETGGTANGAEGTNGEERMGWRGRVVKGGFWAGGKKLARVGLSSKVVL